MASTARAEPHAAGSGWLVGPWFDALLIANVAWPLLVLAQFGEGLGGADGLRFWQIYFVTTPHRWITLALVFLDRDRFAERRSAFLGVAAALAAVVIGVRLSTGTLTCLLAIDYAWNAWHFAAQHHGIYRIYGRLSESAAVGIGLTFEKWSLRLSLLYVILRVAGATWPAGDWEQWLAAGDWLCGATLAALICRDFAASGRRAAGRRLYLASMASLYLGLLWAVHSRRLDLVLPLATASALFHAIEYLALVAWAVHGRHAARAGALGALSYLAPRWALCVGLFLLILGSAGWLLDRQLLRPWLLVNTIIAFWHYAYDGMIWRRGRPAQERAYAA